MSRPLTMRRTRWSLLYVVGYLILAGVLLMIAPTQTLHTFQSNGAYGTVMPRLVGIVLFVLGVLVLQIVRLGIEDLYEAAILLRIFIVGALTALYLDSSDPLFVALAIVVAIGVVLTGVSYLWDRRDLMRRGAAG